jgi:hypothetical protein
VDDDAQAIIQCKTIKFNHVLIFRLNG